MQLFGKNTHATQIMCIGLKNSEKNVCYILFTDFQKG